MMDFTLTGFSVKKRHPVGKFSTRVPLSVRSLACFFQTDTNDICWACKSRTGEATNVPGKICTGSVTEGCNIQDRTFWESY